MIHGEGHLIRYKYGEIKRRGWRKLHLGVSNGFIVANCLSECQKTDGKIAPNLSHQVGRIDSMTADKAYDQSRVYDRGRLNQLHPRVSAVVSASDEATPRQRNLHIKSIKQDGVLAWRRTSGYYRQSEVENMLFRYQKLIGDERKNEK